MLNEISVAKIGYYPYVHKQISIKKRVILIFKFYIIYCNTHERHLCFDHLILNIMLMKKLLLYILIGGILLIGTYGCANYEEDLLDEISPKQMLATVTTEIELADAVYHRDTVLDPAAE